VPDFVVPENFSNFATQVRRRFEMLLKNRVITGVEIIELRQWWRNFDSEEELYLAAHLLDSLVYRTNAMLDSSSHHVLHMILPNALERLGKNRWDNLTHFLKLIRSGNKTLKIRFLAVEGKFLETNGTLTLPAAKSGPTLLRTFARATSVPDSLLIQPDGIHTLDKDIDILIFIDDCLGTGEQFLKFAGAYELEIQSKNRTLIYIPYVAHIEGVAKLKKHLPNLIVCPIELLGPGTDFFSGHCENPALWHRDNTNTAKSVEDFYIEFLKRKGIKNPISKFCLNLSLAFEISTPNNTLKAFYSTEGDWNRLFVR
jgi:hypothetical protein